VLVGEAVEFLGGDAGLDVGTSISSTSAARRPATRIFSICSGVLTVTGMVFLDGSCRCGAGTPRRL
jgi:hypothetical protein